MESGWNYWYIKDGISIEKKKKNVDKLSLSEEFGFITVLSAFWAVLVYLFIRLLFILKVFLV